MDLSEWKLRMHSRQVSQDLQLFTAQFNGGCKSKLRSKILSTVILCESAMVPLCVDKSASLSKVVLVVLQ